MISNFVWFAWANLWFILIIVAQLEGADCRNHKVVGLSHVTIKKNKRKERKRESLIYHPHPHCPHNLALSPFWLIQLLLVIALLHFFILFSLFIFGPQNPYFQSYDFVDFWGIHNPYIDLSIHVLLWLAYIWAMMHGYFKMVNVSYPIFHFLHVKSMSLLCLWRILAVSVPYLSIIG